MDRLQAMKIFERVVEEGGFAAAARAMDMSPPVVTRMVAELEQHLGTRLLQRTTRKLALTDAGESYLQRVRAILHEIDDAEAAAAASTRDLRGTIRIVAAPVLATNFLAPMVAVWHAYYPKLMLDISMDAYASSRVDEFDVTIMVAGEDFDANIVARPLVQGEAIVVASPDYLERRGIPREPQDLIHHDYLRDSSAPVRLQSGPGRKLRLQSLRADVPDEEVDAPAVLQSVSTELLMRAAVDGAGVAVTSRLLAEEHLARGELVHILPGWIFSRYTIYAALPSGRMLPARTRVFLDFLTEHVPRAMAEKSGQLS
ncbi:DNA-binding transcriptional LysR family regulator [Acidovorax delafieldii]|uniref:DNA-binding transcriptional LysR family regulator n=2 Tax=Acidovorax TaxID=12916 RepID=A0AAJ2CA20_ACIDE|nr:MULTISPECIES: LysR family transcriptional regulator [Acidovorax]MBN9626506.1 LysR family transcriptional regulator [Acidovorax sp.]ODS68203.1 MAG: LysR family transcriptional regulator [Acidovorax sp. SCN 65-28]KRA07978.1 LysR family transcriptional regulator [Acidovorax sp. Root568]MCT6720562.1 LysR family transcriptional regulator [Acidovorax sp. K2F]MDR6152249.1 DNA-binding transcriptional LysR family regulator [Acidovorax delafieldii]|eukprot:gene2119-2073_t